jgi:hypothetical protein
LPAVPTVAVLSANSLYGALLVVTFGFSSPENNANTSVAHDWVFRIMRSAFVDANPALVVHDSCRSQLAVSVQSSAWLSGPCKVNIPTANTNFDASP